MSVIASNPQQICNSPLNHSKSKQLYSFPRSPRFRQKRNTPNGIFYDLPPVKNQRAAGLGYGKKYDFTSIGKGSPPPGTYDIYSEIDLSSKKKLGKTFGVGRDLAASQSFIPSTKNVPGPGSYSISNSLSTIKFSFRPKTNILDLNQPSIKNPGPGSYKAYETINSNGHHFIAKFKSSGAPTINPPRNDRFKDFNPLLRNPGPGAYDQPTTINDKGQYFVSKFTSSMCRSFSHAPKRQLDKNRSGSPGPGEYRMPSEFGYYESKYTQNKEQNNTKKKF